MPENPTNPDYVAAAAEWSRARDVLAGKNAVKATGKKCLPKLDSQTEEDYAACKARASSFGGTAHTLDEYLDLIFRPSGFPTAHLSVWISVDQRFAPRPQNPFLRPQFFLNKNTFPLRSFLTHTALNFHHEKP